MGESRLVALCMLHAHPDVKVDFKAVVDSFAAKKQRRMALEFFVPAPAGPAPGFDDSDDDDY